LGLDRFFDGTATAKTKYVGFSTALLAKGREQLRSKRRFFFGEERRESKPCGDYRWE